MSHHSQAQLPLKWSEGRRRAEIYLRALRGRFGSAERDLVVRALTIARAQHCGGAAAHPLTLVMETLFDLLPAPLRPEITPMTPPIARSTMLPEPIEFPCHGWLRRVFRRRRFAFAGPN